MKNFILLILLVIIIGIVVPAQSKTIIISDIDDTLKNAHILDRSDMVKKAYQIEGLDFPFMSNLFKIILNKVKTPEKNTFYLTNAKEWLMGKSHRSFLKRYSFPKGIVYFRNDFDSKTHKPYYLNKIIETEKPDHVILIGDNGEYDPLFYANLVKKYKNSDISFYSFIRVAYSRDEFKSVYKLFNGQIGFTTPVEIITYLLDYDLINYSDSMGLISRIKKYYQYLMPKLFPEWIICRDFTWPKLLSPPTDPDYLILRKRIINRCQS